MHSLVKDRISCDGDDRDAGAAPAVPWMRP
jgi:hypothetical protein